MYTSTVALEDKGPFPTLKEAMRDFMTRMKALVEKGTAAQIVNEACWIEAPDEEIGKFPIKFHQARDLGYALGLIRDGEFVEDAPDPHPQAESGALGLARDISMIGMAETVARF